MIYQVWRFIFWFIYIPIKLCRKNVPDLRSANCCGVRLIILGPFFSPFSGCILLAELRLIWGITYGAFITMGLDWIFPTFEEGFGLFSVIILTGWLICFPPVDITFALEEIVGNADVTIFWTDILFNASSPALVSFNVWSLAKVILESSSSGK